jgi:transposase-like protein
VKFDPPRCPFSSCVAHHKPEGRWYVRKGYYQSACRAEPVQRLRCRHCRQSFSSQTFRHDYRDRKPWCNALLLDYLTSGVGLRQAGRKVGLTIRAVQGKLRKFGRTCLRLHENLSSRLPGHRTYLFDEEETYERSKIWPLTMPVLIERETWFVVAVHAGSIRRLASEGSRRRALQDAHEKRCGRRPDQSRECVRKVLMSLRRRVGEAPVTLLSDEKSSYRTLIRGVFGGAARHETTPGKAPRTTRNPLFPINTTLAMTRDNNGRLRRRSWLVSKLCECLIHQMTLFTVYRNYVRNRFNHDPKNDTPGKLLRLLPRALQSKEVLAWRQDWGQRSIDPMSEDASSTIQDMQNAVANVP